MTGLAGVLARAVEPPSGVPGVAAVVTDAAGPVWSGAAGLRVAGGDEPMTPDTVCAIHSVTKLVTVTVCLQLVEEGRLDLDAPAREHAPELAGVQVLTGFAADGAALLRPPVREITTRMLLLHTAGFGYDHFEPAYTRLVREQGLPPVVAGTRAALRLPLLADPGERWRYGISTDWLGQVVEGVGGRRLGAVMAERVFAPLGMVDTGFDLDGRMRARLARVHVRRPDGTLRPVLRDVLPPDPEVHMGGHGLWSTALDVGRLLRMWLADGASPDGRQVLRPETVRAAATPGTGDLAVPPLRGVDPALAREVELAAGLPRAWAPAGLVNLADVPGGRRAGSLTWAGLANLYYWIDRGRGLAGFWAAQLFPFGDPAALDGFRAFEAAAYRE